MADKKKVNAQAKGRAAKSLRESSAGNEKIRSALEKSSSKDAKSAFLWKPYQKTTNALARNRSAKAKDSRPKKK